MRQQRTTFNNNEQALHDEHGSVVQHSVRSRQAQDELKVVDARSELFLLDCFELCKTWEERHHQQQEQKQQPQQGWQQKHGGRVCALEARSLVKPMQCVILSNISCFVKNQNSSVDLDLASSGDVYQSWASMQRNLYDVYDVAS